MGGENISSFFSPSRPFKVNNYALYTMMDAEINAAITNLLKQEECEIQIFTRGGSDWILREISLSEEGLNTETGLLER